MPANEALDGTSMSHYMSFGLFFNDWQFGWLASVKMNLNSIHSHTSLTDSAQLLMYSGLQVSNGN